MLRKAEISDARDVAKLAVLLWPDHALSELTEEFEGLLSDPDAAVYLAFRGGRAVGFAQCQMRSDYVEGTQTSPVGYLEGIYVLPQHRGVGIAGELLAACEDWAREQGGREFASDCELDNADSLRFHLKAGFIEANRIICFTKEL